MYPLLSIFLTSYLCLLMNWKSLKLAYQFKGEPFPKQALVFTCLLYKSFENTAGKGEIAHDEQFLLFSLCFLSIWKTFFHRHQIQLCFLQTLFVWKSLKLVVWERVKQIARIVSAYLKVYEEN